MKSHIAPAIAAALLAASSAVSAQETATVAANPPPAVGASPSDASPPPDAAATAGPAADAPILPPVAGLPPPEQAPPDGVTPRADAPRQPVSQMDNHFFLRQAMLEREIRLLTLEARRKELQDEIAGKKDEGPVSPGGIVPGGPIIPITAPPASVAPITEAPRPSAPPLPFALLSIYGGEGVYTADFAVGAARVSLTRGGELPGGWSVQSIGPFEVVVRRAGRTKTLRLGG